MPKDDICLNRKKKLSCNPISQTVYSLSKQAELQTVKLPLYGNIFLALTISHVLTSPIALNETAYSFITRFIRKLFSCSKSQHNDQSNETFLSF